MTRVDIFTDEEGEHRTVLIDGVRSDTRVFTSRSLDPANPAVWLDGRRVYGVTLYWNGTLQFSVPAAMAEMARDGPAPEPTAETPR